MARTVDRKVLEGVVALMAQEGNSYDRTLQLVSSLVGDDTLALRVVEWLPEAFGYAVVSRIPGLTLPKTFQVKNAQGHWQQLPLADEPLWAEMVSFAESAFSTELDAAVADIALRSSMLDVVNAALNFGADLSGAAISGPAFVGLRAEISLPGVGVENTSALKRWADANAERLRAQGFDVTLKVHQQGQESLDLDSAHIVGTICRWPCGRCELQINSAVSGEVIALLPDIQLKDLMALLQSHGAL